MVSNSAIQIMLTLIKTGFDSGSNPDAQHD